MILQALNGYYERMSAQADSRIAPPGFSYQPISFAIVLAADGCIVDIDDLRESDGRRSRPRSLLVPQPPKRSGKKPKPGFLSDKTEYVFGLGRKKESEILVENPAYRQMFISLHDEALRNSSDVGLLAICRFLQQWSPAQYGNLRFANEMASTNVVFRLDGAREFVHAGIAAKSAWLQLQAKNKSKFGQCLILGVKLPIARLHPRISGIIKDGQKADTIVGFNAKAFTSYGKEQGANAPVSEQAAFAYTTALNELLRRDSKQKVQIGDATTVFWAESDDHGAAAAAEQVFGFLVEPSSERADAAATDRLRTEVMERMAHGRPLESPEFKLDPATRFYILGLSPNAARLSVRFWEATTLGALGEAFHQYWQDLRLEGSASRKVPPSIAACALRTAPARKDRQDRLKFSFDDVAPQLAGELMRSILTGNRYPGSLLATLIMRVRSDGVLDPVRVSLIKATIVRAMRLEGRLPLKDGQPIKEYLVRTDPNDINPARRLGRLFAVLERAQLAALGDNVNTTIKDKFLGAAAATPAQVFVGLIKNSQHHTKRLRNGHSDAKWIKDSNHARRVGFGIERDVGRLWGSFNEGLPGQHSIEEQGLFFVGYYQERFGGRPDESVGTEPGIDTTETPDDQE